MSDAKSAPAKHKHRSPNHPVLDLREAIEKVAKLQKTYGTHAVPLATFCKAFNYVMNGSGANQLLAALKAYALVNVSGKGDSRKIAVSPTAERIVRGAPDRQKLIREAALEPAIHKEVWEHYEQSGDLPHDDILRQYLVWERPEGQRFNQDTVDAFIARLRSTLGYAGIAGGGKIGGNGGGELNGNRPKVGDFVQWASGGVEQFKAPRRVESIETADDGTEWVYVEDADTAVAMEELTVVDPPEDEAGERTHQRRTPPKRKLPPKHDGPYISFPLSDDNVVELTLTSRVSRKDFERLKKLIDLSEDSLVSESE